MIKVLNCITDKIYILSVTSSANSVEIKEQRITIDTGKLTIILS